MGYMLSSVGNLPLDENIDLYIFVVNGQWLGEPYETIDRNFSKLAKRIGERAVIVKGLESQAWTPTSKEPTSAIARRYSSR